ncbi:MAG: hypothetical protein ACLTQI_09455 [Slackia sp.]
MSGAALAGAALAGGAALTGCAPSASSSKEEETSASSSTSATTVGYDGTGVQCLGLVKPRKSPTPMLRKSLRLTLLLWVLAALAFLPLVLQQSRVPSLYASRLRPSSTASQATLPFLAARLRRNGAAAMASLTRK